MFGLPAFTTAVLVIIPMFWIIYTAVFWVMSRNWHLADEAAGATATSATATGASAAEASSSGQAAPDRAGG